MRGGADGLPSEPNGGYHSVVASDIQPSTPYFLRFLARDHGIHVPYLQANILDSGNHPLSGRRFGAVCLSGVLEHVPDFTMFLTRIRLLLDPDAYVFIFRFPNRTSWIEWVAERWLRRGTSHPLRFTREELHLMLRWHGFRVEHFVYEEILPVNLRGFPGPMRALYRAVGWLQVPVSGALCRTPLVSRLATSFRFVCRKAKTKS